MTDDVAPMNVPDRPPELYAALVEQASDAIIFADRGGRVVVWNPGAERLFGLAAKDVIGERLDVIIPEHLRAAHWEAFERAMASRTTRHDGRAMITRSMRGDGSKLYVAISFALVKDASGAIVGSVAMARDAGDRRAEAGSSRR